MDNQDIDRKARKRVAAKIGLYIHTAAYVVGNLVLVAINLAVSRDHPWFIWPLMGWGVGLFFHAVVVYALLEGSPIKERMVERELKRLSAERH